MTWRGGERQLFLLLKELQRSELVQLVLYCPVGSELAERAAELEQVKLVCFRSRISAAKWISRREKADIIHVHDSHAHTIAYVSAVLFGNNCPFVVSRRVDFPVASSFFSKLKYTHRNVKAILCVSRAIEEIVRRALPISGAEIRTVYSGIDLEDFAELKPRDLHRDLGIPSDRFILLNASALEDHKDYPTFIRTIHTLTQKGRPVHGVIYGVGSLREELGELVRTLELDSRITFAGFDPKVRECIAAADAFLFTSKMEGLGTVVLDAFASGVPVVATNAGGIPEMVVNELSGLLSEKGDHLALADNTERLMDQPELRKRLIDGARERLGVFSVAETARLSLETYQRVLSENP